MSYITLKNGKKISEQSLSDIHGILKKIEREDRFLLTKLFYIYCMRGELNSKTVSFYPKPSEVIEQDLVNYGLMEGSGFLKKDVRKVALNSLVHPKLGNYEMIVVDPTKQIESEQLQQKSSLKVPCLLATAVVVAGMHFAIKYLQNTLLAYSSINKG